MVCRFIVAILLLTSFGEFGEGQVRSNLKPSGLAKEILEEASFKLKTQEAKNFRFHFESGSLAEGDLNGLQRYAEEARTKALVLLGEKKDFLPVIDLFYISSREQMHEIMGTRVKGFNHHKSRTVVLVYNDSTRAYHNHEVMHAVSLDLWGFPADSNHCLIEGIAVYADNPCLGYPVHKIAAYLMYKQEIIPFTTLFSNFRKQDELLAYMEAGSVVQYLVEKYGVEKVKELWQKGKKEIQYIFGLTLKDLEFDYLNFLVQQYPVKPEVNWPLLQTNGCG